MTHPEPSAGWTPPPGTPLVTQADRWSWQRRAVRALADILDAHPGLPQVAWHVGPTGALTGLVSGFAPAEEVRATFTAWQGALRLEDIREAPIRDTGITSLSGRGYHGTVHVGLTARVYGPFPDDEEPVGVPEADAGPRPDGYVGRAPASRPAVASQRTSASPARPDRPQAGPLIPPRTPEGPQPAPGL